MRVRNILAVSLNSARYRAAALTFLTVTTIVHGRILDAAPQHTAVAGLPLTFCKGLRVATHRNDQEYACGSRRWRVTTDRMGRFSLAGITKGWYIEAGRSADVAYFEGMVYLDPAHASTQTFACSYKTQPLKCANPKTFGSHLKL